MQALVRYGPEEFGLEELLAQARGDLRSGIRSARGTARSVIGAVDQARPEVQEVYDDAGTRQAGIASNVDTELAGMQGVPSSIAAARATAAVIRRRSPAFRPGGRADVSANRSRLDSAARQGRVARCPTVHTALIARSA